MEQHVGIPDGGPLNTNMERDGDSTKSHLAPVGQRSCLLPVFRLQRTQGIGVAESRELALGYELLLQHRLLLVLRALRHEPLDGFVVLVLVGAEVDERVFLIQPLLTLGVRCVEFLNPGLAIVFGGGSLRSGATRNAPIPCDLLAGEARGGCDDKRDNRSANKDGLGHLWFRTRSEKIGVTRLCRAGLLYGSNLAVCHRSIPWE